MQQHRLAPATIRRHCRTRHLGSAASTCKAGNGEIIASNKNTTTKVSVFNEIESVRKNAATASVDGLT